MKHIFRIVMVIGMLVIIGTAGSSDLELISAGREFLQLTGGLLMVIAGFVFGKAWEG